MGSKRNSVLNQHWGMKSVETSPADDRKCHNMRLFNIVTLQMRDRLKMYLVKVYILK
jgi:hypothetical protein